MSAEADHSARESARSHPGRVAEVAEWQTQRIQKLPPSPTAENKGNSDLTHALKLAAEAGRWDVVQQLAALLEGARS